MRSSQSYLASVGILLTLIQIRPYQAAFPTLLESCCSAGKAWFTQSQERCSFHQGPFDGVSLGADTKMCQAVVEICCLRVKKDKQCTRGKQISRIRNSCEALHSKLGNMHTRECCNCCKLGQVARTRRLSCRLLDHNEVYTKSCSSTFKECCIGDDSLTTTTSQPITRPTTPSLNECEQFSNQLCAHICIDTPFSYRCSCNPGYTLQADGRTCKQEVRDRCKINNPCQQICVDTGVAITCKCVHGFNLQVDASTCEDENECENGMHNCAAHQKCVNSLGSFACEGLSRPRPGACPRGYEYNSDTKTCEDLDECHLTPHGLCRAHEMCVNIGGSYTCVRRNPNDHTSCDKGFRYNVATQSCQDINECILNRDACLDGQICENTAGTYLCRRGISCGTGYTLDQASQSCKDDDECSLGTDNCGLARKCENTQGSFRCVSKGCPPGTTMHFSTGTCRAVICSSGLRPNRGGNCVDVNECIDTPTVCRPHQRCSNTIGSYTCQNILNCRRGYRLNEAGNSCEDVNECETGAHECKGDLMTCVNRHGSYTCSCPDGYHTNHRTNTCDDINECSRYRGQICTSNSQCENTQGSYMCRCNAGFQSNGNGQLVQCKDIDECETVSDLCVQTCLNTWGSYQCSCTSGYKLAADKKSCEDVDECSRYPDGGLCPGQCNNTPGSFTCSCPAGFDLMQDGRTCQDINECAHQATRCSGTDKLCINTRGSHKCETITCPKGFVRAPSLGNSNNNIRCQRQTFVCPQGDTECLFAPLSYSMNFITFPSHIQIPADLFTMRGPYSQYRRLEFELKLVTAVDPITGETRVTSNFFNLRRVSTNEAIVQLVQQIEGPQDLELDLNMSIYSREFQEGSSEVFFGTAVAKIKVFVTSSIYH